MTNRAFRLIVVEDNEDDLYLLLRALGQKAPPHVATCCRDGDEALRTLSSMEHLPDLVLVDMGLPKIDGLELLAEIRKRPELADIPVMMLSTSGDPARTMAAQRLRGMVVIKPIQYEAFMDSIGRAVSDALTENSHH